MSCYKYYRNKQLQKNLANFVFKVSGIIFWIIGIILEITWLVRITLATLSSRVGLTCSKALPRNVPNLILRLGFCTLLNYLDLNADTWNDRSDMILIWKLVSRIRYIQYLPSGESLVYVTHNVWIKCFIRDSFAVLIIRMPHKFGKLQIKCCQHEVLSHDTQNCWKKTLSIIMIFFNLYDISYNIYITI